MLSVANFQRRAWQRFFSKEIYQVFEDAGFTESGIAVRFEPSNPDKFLDLGVMTAKMDDTLMETLGVNIHLTDMNNDSGSNSVASSVEFQGIELVTFPILTEFGFVINGSKKGVISKLRPASGWYFTISKSTGQPVLELRRETQCKIRICQSK